jgi:hypothetical protein
MLYIIRNAQISLKHIAFVVGWQLAADDNRTLRICKRVAHFAIGAVAAKDNVISTAPEPNRDDMGIAIRTNGREPSDARLLQELANPAI